MGKENIQIKRVFYYKIYRAPNLYLTLRVLPIEFILHNFGFVRFVFVEISGFFELAPRTTGSPEKDPKNSKNCKFFQFFYLLLHFLSIFR